MKCMSCSVEIDPKWKHAINANVCPFCGQTILEEKLKDLLSSLQKNMEELKEYSSQLNDWLFSNFEYVKVNSVQWDMSLPKKSAPAISPLPYSQTLKDDKSGEEVIVTKIQDDKKTSEFFERAEAVKPRIDGFTSVTDKTQKLKNMVKEIKSGAHVGASDELTVGEGESLEAVSESEINDIFEENKQQNVSSSIDMGEEIPHAVLAMANNVGQGGMSAQARADLLRLERLKNRGATNENFESGANRGKNGFSRSG